MASHCTDGASYLVALKQVVDPAAAAAAESAQGANVAIDHARSADPGPVAPSGAERRRSPRYACEGSAEIRQENQDVRTWATFTDVSVHGCYVEAAATYPVGTILHLKLEGNGFQIFTTGSVRVSYPYLGMGIGFTEISEENKTRLRDLLRSITRPTVVMGSGSPSPRPSSTTAQPQPALAGSDPASTVRALIEYFENRYMLTREEFWRILEQTRGSR